MYTLCIRGSVVSVVISVRVPRWVKEKLEEHGVNIPELVRQKLIEEARRLEEESLDRELEELGRILAEKLDPSEVVRLVKEDRLGR